MMISVDIVNSEMISKSEDDHGFIKAKIWFYQSLINHTKKRDDKTILENAMR